MPPVARITARASTLSASPRRGCATRPTQRPSTREQRTSPRAARAPRCARASAASADSSRVMRRPVAAPPACTMRRREWPPSRPSARLPWRSASKWTPSRSRSRTRAGRLGAQHLHGARARGVAAGGERVGHVQRGRVVGGQRGRDAALGPVGGGLGQRRAAHERHARALLGDADSARTGRPRRRPPRPRPRSAAQPRGSRAGTVPAPVPAVLQPPVARSSTTPGSAIPSGWAACRRSRPSSSAATGSASSAARRRRRRIEQLLAVHPREHVDAVRETSARAGAFDLDTPTSEGSWERRAARGGRRLRARRGAAGRRASASASRRCARPGTTPSTTRAMGFCLFANVSVAARHALDSLGAERVLRARLGRAPRQRHQRDLPRVARGAVREHPPVPVLSGHRAAVRRRRGGGRGLLDQPAGARPGAGEDVFCGLVEHVVLPAARAFDPDLVLVSAGYDAHRDDPVGGCALETSSFAELTRQVLTLGKPVGYVLEGGYDLDALAGSVAASMEVLAAGGEPGAHPRGAAGGAGRGAVRPLLGRWARSAARRRPGSARRGRRPGVRAPRRLSKRPAKTIQRPVPRS